MELRGNVFDVGCQLPMPKSRGRIKSSDESPEERVPWAELKMKKNSALISHYLHDARRSF